jgi:hypothetical protein
MRVWKRKRKDQVIVEPEERRSGEFGTGRVKIGEVSELKERVQEVLPKITNINYGRGI